MVLFAVGLAFGLGRLALRFEIDDINKRRADLQARRLDLDSKVRRLEAKVESLRRVDRLVRHAENDRGMVRTSPGEARTVRLSAVSRREYARAIAALARAREVEGKPSAADLAESLVARLGLTGQAQAQEDRR